MLILEEIADASLKPWGHIKLWAQIFSYIGLSATAALGVFDFLYEQRGKKADRHNRLPLNPSGRKHVYFYIGIAVITLVATVLKDVADSKLSNMATEVAKADLRKALGDNLESFATNALKPSLAAISSDIDSQRAALNDNIHQSTDILDKALKKTRSDLSQSATEVAADTEMSDVKINSFEISLAIGPETMEVQTVTPPTSLVRWKKVASDNCNTVQASDQQVQLACKKLKMSIDELTNLGSFVRLLDPEGSGYLSIDIALVSSTIHVAIKEKCIPLPLPGAAAETQQCIILEDVGERMIDSSKVEIMQYGVFAPPRMTVIEHGAKRPGTDAQTDPLENVFGRNIRLKSVVIMADVANKRFTQRLPKQLVVMEEISSDNGHYFYTGYHLRLANTQIVHTPNQMGPDMTWASYVRE